MLRDGLAAREVDPPDFRDPSTGLDDDEEAVGIGFELVKKIRAVGRHDDLLVRKGLYYAMWRQQIGEKRPVLVSSPPPLKVATA